MGDGQGNAVGQHDRHSDLERKLKNTQKAALVGKGFSNERSGAMAPRGAGADPPGNSAGVNRPYRGRTALPRYYGYGRSLSLCERQRPFAWGWHVTAGRVLTWIAVAPLMPNLAGVLVVALP
jgi:hypothetical protein